jgi:SAM-dependent methyltransferase
MSLRKLWASLIAREPAAKPVDAPLFRLLVGEPWMIESFAMDQVGESLRVEIRGWALPDPEFGAASPGRFLINGKPFSEIQYPSDREDVGRTMWLRENSRYSGFRCVESGTRDSLYPGGVMELAYENPGPPRRVPAQQSWFCFDPKSEGPIPDEVRRYRVVGNHDPTAFLQSGFTDFRRLDAAAEALSGTGFAGHARILDWGCGCGRLARYAAQLPGVALSGCDIDAGNVAWCSTNLNGSFTATKLHPPLPYADSSFDLIYGLSVFTHLREPLQTEWLAELNRVSAPGALLLMTIHGQTALDYAGVALARYQEFGRVIREQGVHQSGTNGQLDGYAEHEGEYVNVFHDLDYVRAHWGELFEILDILPGYVFTHDLVVMRQRT